MTQPGPDKVRAAVKTGVERTEVRDFPRPVLPPHAGLLKVEACGVGGAEPEIYRSEKWTNVIMGHQVVGRIAELGPIAQEMWNIQPGERVVLQEYLPCKQCRFCAEGAYRYCPQADFFGAGEPKRFGLMDSTSSPHLWGGFSEYLYLPWNVVIHRIPQDLPADLATLAIPLGNGVQWATMDVNASAGKKVLIIGPGQQGLGAVIAAKLAGADCVILAGLSRDQARLDLARRIGADHIINADKESLVARIKEITSNEGLDVVVDTTGDPGGKNLEQYLQVVAQGAYLWVNAMSEGVPVRELKKKFITARSGRGRTYQAVERALQIISSRKLPLEHMCTHHYGLKDVDLALKATAGREAQGAIHVVVEPWR